MEVLDLWRTEVTRVRKDLVRTYGKRKKMICQVTIHLLEFPKVPILKIKVENTFQLDSSEVEDYTSLHMFLAAHGLMDWASKLTREKIDLDALMLLTEADLADSLGMPLGHRKKLMKAIEDRRRDMEEPDSLTDTRF